MQRSCAPTATEPVRTSRSPGNKYPTARNTPLAMLRASRPYKQDIPRSEITFLNDIRPDLEYRKPGRGKKLVESIERIRAPVGAQRAGRTGVPATLQERCSLAASEFGSRCAFSNCSRT